MFRFFREYSFALVLDLLISFYLSYFVTVNYQIVTAHISLVKDHEVVKINFGIITFVIFALLPWLIWKMTVNSEIPILRETLGLRLLLSRVAAVFTLCLFMSKSIFNSIAKPVLSWNDSIVFGEKGRIVLIESFAIAIPLVLFLYLTKKVVSHFITKSREQVG